MKILNLITKIYVLDGKCVRRNTLYQFIGYFPSRVTKLGKFGLNGSTLNSHTPTPLILPPFK